MCSSVRRSIIPTIVRCNDVNFITINNNKISNKLLTPNGLVWYVYLPKISTIYPYLKFYISKQNSSLRTFMMESLNPEEVLKFLDLVNNLKHSSRRGWELCDIKNHENIAGHMYSMAMMTFLLGNNSNLDRFKCLQLALVHDLAESIVGDITPYDNIPEEKKHAMEDEAMKKLTTHLGAEIGSLIYNLYKEYEAKETSEAKFVKDLDRFDMLFTAAHYERRDETPRKLQEFFDATEGKFQHSYIRKLVNALEQRRSNQMDLELKIEKS